MVTAVSTNTKKLFFWYMLMCLFGWLLLTWLACKFCFDKENNEKQTQAVVLTPSEQNDNEKNAVPQKTEAFLDNTEPTLVPVASTAALFAVNAAEGISLPEFDNSDSFNFPANEFNHFIPLSDALQANLIKLKEVLSQSVDYRLQIVGKYRGDEENVTMYPNLGVARANDIKSFLVSKGFSERQLDLASLKDNSINADKNNTLYSMVGFNLTELSESEQADERAELALIKERISSDPLVLHFDLGEAEIGMTDKQRDQILNIVRYLGKNKGSRISVVGHTDSLGTEKDNLALGETRAEFATKFLTDNGLDISRIDISSRGESQPISDNASKEARAKNRRAVVSIN